MSTLPLCPDLLSGSRHRHWGQDGLSILGLSGGLAPDNVCTVVKKLKIFILFDISILQGTFPKNGKIIFWYGMKQRERIMH